MRSRGLRASLRGKTLLIVAATTLGLLVALYVPLRALLLGSFRELEDEAAQRNGDRARNAIREDVESLHASCRDYAVWDDTYAFLGGSAPDYPAINLVDETFAHNRLGAVVLVDASGVVRFAKEYDLVHAVERPAADWGARMPVLCPERPCAPAWGLLDAPEGPLLVAVHPVLPSDAIGAPHGALVLGRPLDDAEVVRLASALEMELSVTRLADTAGRRELDAARASPRRLHAEPLDDDRIAAYAILDDVSGAPYLAARVEMPREIYARGVLGTRSLMLAVAIACLVFGLVVLLLIDRVVLRRVSALSEDVRRISEFPDPGVRVAVDGDDELTRLSEGINGMLGELARAREVIRSAFGRYVSEEVAEAILSNPEAAQLGGETRDVTILFSDIRGYSTISERLAPTEVVTLLNEYFGAMSEEIEAEGGCVIELLGDAILAVFGAPIALDDHPDRAVRAALAMQRRGAELNREWDAGGRSQLWKEHGIGALASRIGLHTGHVVVGNLGSRKRMKYAVIGDTVNLAARVEALNEVLGTDVLLTAEVLARLDGKMAEQAQDRGEHAVKGREQPVHVYTLDP